MKNLNVMVMGKIFFVSSLLVAILKLFGISLLKFAELDVSYLLPFGLAFTYAMTFVTKEESNYEVKPVKKEAVNKDNGDYGPIIPEAQTLPMAEILHRQSQQQRTTANSSATVVEEQPPAPVPVSTPPAAEEPITSASEGHQWDTNDVLDVPEKNSPDIDGFAPDSENTPTMEEDYFDGDDSSWADNDVLTAPEKRPPDVEHAYF